MIVGTAGHIDHGKTTLVHALTGVDTDRLAAEKLRGISIELGYAYQPLPAGGVLGFVDVPGHERFIHTMLAGAAGIDFALLVVAADDGVMPQTREHLNILDLLGIERGAVALTKIDRVEPVRVAEVERELVRLLAETALAGMPVFPVSATGGRGVDALRAHLHAAAQAMPQAGAEGGFRLAVDRSFTLKGAGTIVTGTVFAGRVEAGDELLVTPSGRPVRLRSLHVMNRPAQTGQAGQRCALNLAGAGKDEIARGDWIVAPRLHAPTARFDARLTLSPQASAALTHWAPVHLHLGAAHVMARVALLEGENLAPGESALAQLVADRPLGALHGDRFILRAADARHTLGGGRVLDPDAPARRRKTASRLAELAALDIPDPARRLRQLLDLRGFDLDRLAVHWNRTDLATHLPPHSTRVRAGHETWAFPAAHWQSLQDTLRADLAGFHERFPDELGPDAARARRMFLPSLPAAVFAALTDALLAAGTLQRSGPWLHLPTHRVALTREEEALTQRIRPWLAESPFDPPWVRDLARMSGKDEATMRRLLQKLARQGTLYQVVRDLFYLPEAVARLAALVQELEHARGETRAAEFRDRSGLSRKRAVQVLEFFDRMGYTRRVREAHRLRNPDLFGRAEQAA
ncbi:MAG: selenocysteine-specific translation elongation factor [Candidatus Thermoplasmatota archaeon]|nr:selenocysteine-specific translation elongation factor [Candidatus Thermoplasmatota archaeon]